MTDAKADRAAPVFVVGVARSGTTLLSAMLSAHSRLDCGPESRFFARYRHLDREAQRRTLQPDTWPGPAVDFIASLRNQRHPIVDLFGLSIQEIRGWLAARPPSLGAMLESLTVLHAEQAGKTRWVEKTPRHLLMIGTIRSLWPDAAIVRIVRDPRDVAMSLSSMPFAKASPVGNLVRIDQDDRASRGPLASDPLTMTLRYEDLVSAPERELRRVCSFIGEDYEPAMLDSREKAGDVVADHEWWKESVAGSLQTSRIGRWKTEMAPNVQRFASLHLCGYLREHGYEGAADPTSELAILPVADAVGPKNERLLVELAQNGTVALRPPPLLPAEQHPQPTLLFVGTRGQLDPSRNRSALQRVVSAGLLGTGLLVRRVSRRPMLWIRRPTLRARRPNDPGELLLALLLRLFARQVNIEQAAIVERGPG